MTVARAKELLRNAEERERILKEESEAWCICGHQKFKHRPFTSAADAASRASQCVVSNWNGLYGACPCTGFQESEEL